MFYVPKAAIQEMLNQGSQVRSAPTHVAGEELMVVIVILNKAVTSVIIIFLELQVGHQGTNFVLHTIIIIQVEDMVVVTEDHTHYAILLGMEAVDKNTTVMPIEINFQQVLDFQQ